MHVFFIQSDNILTNMPRSNLYNAKTECETKMIDQIRDISIGLRAMGDSQWAMGVTWAQNGDGP